MLFRSIRERAAQTQKMMDEWDYKYKPGQHVFTEDSARKNFPPMRILDRARSGYQVMREDMNDPFSKKIIDPATGRAMRTPYEPGYRVRMERGPDDWSEFIIPEKAIKGDVEMALGGLAHYDDGGTVDKAKLMAEILARMAKDQGKEEIESLKKPRAATDLINRGLVANAVGAPVDLINMGLTEIGRAHV